MSLFQNRPQTSDPTNFYTVGLNKTVLLVGLGNVGEQYENTRHNAGFICLDDFVSNSQEMSDWMQKKDLKCIVSTGQMGGCRVIAIKPTTFMNLSGDAVQSATHFYKITAENIIVVHDELDVDFGQIRLRVGGSSAGHNGIKSVSEQIGEDYGRIRIGVGPKTPEQIKSEDFVLQNFSEAEQGQLTSMTREINAILNEYIFGQQMLPQETRSFLV